MQSRDNYSIEKGNLTSATHLATIAIRLPAHYDDYLIPRWTFRIHNGNLVFIDKEASDFSSQGIANWDQRVYAALIQKDYKRTLNWDKMSESTSSVQILSETDAGQAQDFIVYGNINKTNLDRIINDTVEKDWEFAYWKNNMNITIHKNINVHQLKGYTWHNKNSVTVTLKNDQESLTTRQLYSGGNYTYDGSKIKMDNWENWEKNKDINPFSTLDKYQGVWIGWDNAIECPGDDNLRNTIYNNMGDDRKEMRDYLKANAWCEQTHYGTNAGQVTYHLGKETTMPVTLLLNHWGWKDINSGWGNYQDHSLSRF